MNGGGKGGKEGKKERKRRDGGCVGTHPYPNTIYT